MDNRPSHYRSFFWPIVLIGVGLIWLLANMGWIGTPNLAVLARLWPLLLIAAGLDLLIARRAPLVGALIGLLTLAAVIALLLAGPSLGLAPETNVRTDRYNAPTAGTSAAQVRLDLWSDPATVGAVSDPNNLIEIEATHTGEIDFRSSGEAEKTIQVSHRSGDSTFWFGIGQDLHTDIRLSPQVPLNLFINVGSGSARLNLTELQLTALEVDGGSGSSDLNLPAGGEGYDARVQSSSGSMDIAIPDGAQVTLRLDTGSGSVTLEIPEDAAVRVEVRDDGSGSLNVTSALEQIERSGDDQGVWETPNFAGSARPIVVILDGVGSGSVSIR